MRKLSAAALMVASGLGCSSGGGGSGGGGGTLTCDWLAGDNCWKQTANAATRCLPPADEHGTLSADGRTCTYASGAVITFASPLVLPLPDDPTWNFTVSNGGQTCLHYEDVNGRLKLVVGDQAVTEAPSGGLGLAITCPDGMTYSNPNAFDLLSCDADGGSFFGGLPGSAWSGTDTTVSLGIIGTTTGDSESLPAFDCRR